MFISTVDELMLILLLLSWHPHLRCNHITTSLSTPRALPCWLLYCYCRSFGDSMLLSLLLLWFFCYCRCHWLLHYPPHWRCNHCTTSLSTPRNFPGWLLCIINNNISNRHYHRHIVMHWWEQHWSQRWIWLLTPILMIMRPMMLLFVDLFFWRHKSCRWYIIQQRWQCFDSHPAATSGT